MMKKAYTYIFIWSLLTATLQWGCVKKPDVETMPIRESRPLLQVLQNNYAFSMFYSALLRTGLDKMLAGEGPYTLLVPNNDAFAQSGITTDSLLKIDTASLKKLISYHILPGNVTYSSIPQTIDYPFKSLAGPLVYTSIPIPGPGQNQFPSAQNPILHINGFNVTKADVKASNGLIHVLDGVLSYPAISVKAYLENTPKYSLFTQALKKFGVFTQLDKVGPYAVLAPTNDVFMQFGIDEATIAGLDTLRYRKFLFSGYILPSKLFFNKDFDDAPPVSGNSGGYTPAYFFPDAILIYQRYVGFSMGPFNFLELSMTADPYIFNGAQQTQSINDPDHLAINGIVHGINGLLVLPDSVKIK